ncbi:unnamed protein product, partial [Ectocarpus sp. 12 AP-2014]
WCGRPLNSTSCRRGRRACLCRAGALRLLWDWDGGGTRQPLNKQMRISSKSTSIRTSVTISGNSSSNSSGNMRLHRQHHPLFGRALRQGKSSLSAHRSETKSFRPRKRM